LGTSVAEGVPNLTRMIANDDNFLPSKAAGGDVGAFARLVQIHSGLVYRVALRMVGAEEAQDASQGVWLRVWRNVRHFRGDSAFGTWLYKITVNTCLNSLRKERRREARETDDEFFQLPTPPGGEDDPEAATLSRERMGEVVEALKGIRAEHRAAVVLRHMEGLSYVEIAQILEVPEGTAKGWASRGRAALLLMLVPESRDGDGERAS
jgi:RNA polymerase sigma-70 factor, ECF subfamily